MIESPLVAKTLFTVGPVRITEPIVVTWGLMAVLTIASLLTTRSLAISATRFQAVIELIVGAIEDQIQNTMRVTPKSYVPIIGTLFVFILAANWSSLLPGIEPPTAHIETDAALGLIVFCAIIYFGIRARGVGGYLKTFAEPSIVMIPLNVVETFTRTFSLIVRLFGNVMSGVFIIGIVLSLAGLLVPIPLMALELLIGAIQAYIFTVLAMVFIGAAVGAERTGGAQPRGKSMNWTEIVSILAAAVAVSFGAIGPALAEGRAVAAAMEAIARQPDAAGTISRTLFVGLAMIETMAIYCLVIALLVLFANPFIR
jgi:F-type H+-transporting ATPase subunit a